MNNCLARAHGMKTNHRAPRTSTQHFPLRGSPAPRDAVVTYLSTCLRPQSGIAGWGSSSQVVGDDVVVDEDCGAVDRHGEEVDAFFLVFHVEAVVRLVYAGRQVEEAGA